ncbi:hypothetical protein DFJ43DRAFT_1088968, partial [Lentinula guzmanii]
MFCISSLCVFVFCFFGSCISYFSCTARLFFFFLAFSFSFSFCFVRSLLSSNAMLCYVMLCYAMLPLSLIIISHLASLISVPHKTIPNPIPIPNP